LLPKPLPSALASALYKDAPKCKFPKSLAPPKWLPADLPLPPGTYHSENLPGSIFGYKRALFVVPGPLIDLARFVLDRWPKAGWTLGRGDSEGFEVEAPFTKPPAAGAFKAQGQYCNPPYSLMLLIYTPNTALYSPTPAPTYSPSPLTVSPSPSG
jgi:hypothetical protein